MLFIVAGTSFIPLHKQASNKASRQAGKQEA